MTTRPAADHADQTSTVLIRHVAAESAPATVDGAIVPTLAESQHIGNGKKHVKRPSSVTYNRL